MLRAACSCACVHVAMPAACTCMCKLVLQWLRWEGLRAAVATQLPALPCWHCAGMACASLQADALPSHADACADHMAWQAICSCDGHLIDRWGLW